MISFTSKAKNKLIDLIIKNNGKVAFLYLKWGGCNGFSYKFKILHEDIKPNKLDESYNLDDKNLYLCNSSLMFIIGTKVDYIQDIMDNRFDFKNTNIDSKCRCGTSFNFKFN